MIHMGIFVGLGQFEGWRFSLQPMRHAQGAPGYVRRPLAPCPSTQAALRRAAEQNAKLAPELAAAFLDEAQHPTADWVEEQWPIEWLRRGLIRKVEDREDLS